MIDKEMNLNRDFCVFSGNRDLELLHSFGDFPVYMGCVDTPPEEDVFKPMNWYISKSSGSLQMNPLVPLDLVYLGQHNDSTGSIWDAHHAAFSNFILKNDIEKIFEIGGASGALYRKCSAARKLQWTILDPNPEVNEADRLRTIKGFFDKTFSMEVSFDILVHSHVFEHVYNPMEFAEALSNYIPEGKLMAFSVPNMKHLLEKCYTNALNFEHSYFLTADYVRYLLTRNGFAILSIEPFMNHSQFYLCRKVEAVESGPLPDLYEQNKKLFMNFINIHKEVIIALNEYLNKTSEPVYLFGAHIFSQFLIAFGLNTDRIVTVLDNSPVKISRRLYGTDYLVQSPAVLKDLPAATVILRAGDYSAEIKKDIVENINSHINWLE